MSITALVAHLRRPATAGAALTVVLALGLSACGGSDSGTTTDQTAPATGQAGQGGGQGARQPGVSGLVAAISGKTLQVQGSDAQTAVTYTAKTTFTEVTTAKATDLETGLCATVRSAPAASGAPTAAVDQVTAESVTLSTAADGTCSGGFGGGNRPSGAPSGMPSGAPSTRTGGGGFGTSGKVLSIDGDSFVVEATGRSAGTTKVTVTTPGTTTWSQVDKTTAKAVAVGKCATATGTTAATGALTATTLRLSKATNGTCATGFGGGRGGQAPSAAPTHG